MNEMYYEVSMKFDKVQESGLIKKVTEKYLANAVSFTEAEARAAEYIKQYAQGEFDIFAIKRTKIAGIFESKNTAADRYYSAKVAWITIDEKTGAEKRTMQVMLVKATDFDDARNAIQEGMKDSVGDWEKAQLSETQIVDIIEA